jgi:hypothetical protein
MSYFNNLQQVKNYLIENKQSCLNLNIWSKYYIHFLPQSSEFERFLRIEELNGGYFGTRFGATYRPIGSIDLKINKNKKIIEILWWMVNDEQHHIWTPGLYAPPLSELDAYEMKQNLLLYAEHIAKKYNSNKIQRVVHPNLTEYNQYLKHNSYILTIKREDDNSFWLKTYKNL